MLGGIPRPLAPTHRRPTRASEMVKIPMVEFFRGSKGPLSAGIWVKEGILIIMARFL